MIEKSNYLFIYGTLLNAHNEFAIYLKQNCSFWGKGRFKGKLYDLGEYPGAIADNNSGYVYGNIFRITNPSEVFKYLDDYEGFGEDQDQPNLFVRQMASVETDGTTIDCWIYLYNLPVDGFRLIESGDYITYKRI